MNDNEGAFLSPAFIRCVITEGLQYERCYDLSKNFNLESCRKRGRENILQKTSRVALWARSLGLGV